MFIAMHDVREYKHGNDTKKHNTSLVLGKTMAIMPQHRPNGKILIVPKRENKGAKEI